MIRPSDVQVEDACFTQWEEQIDKILAEPWAEDEMYRSIDLEHPSLSKQGQSVFRLLWQAYEELGWKVSPKTPDRRADRFITLRFARPRMFNAIRKQEP